MNMYFGYTTCWWYLWWYKSFIVIMFLEDEGYWWCSIWSFGDVFFKLQLLEDGINRTISKLQTCQKTSFKLQIEHHKSTMMTNNNLHFKMCLNKFKNKYKKALCISRLLVICMFQKHHLTHWNYCISKKPHHNSKISTINNCISKWDHHKSKLKTTSSTYNFIKYHNNSKINTTNKLQFPKTSTKSKIIYKLQHHFFGRLRLKFNIS